MSCRLKDISTQSTQNHLKQTKKGAMLPQKLFASSSLEVRVVGSQSSSTSKLRTKANTLQSVQHSKRYPKDVKRQKSTKANTLLSIQYSKN